MTGKNPLSAYREGLRRLAASVAIVSSGAGESAVGMTVTSATSLSFEPPSLIVCINRNASLHGPLRASGIFRVTWLRAEDEKIADIFARSGATHAARFATGGWTDAPYGPRLADPLAEACCALDQVVEYGTHALLLARVREAGCGTGDPLLFRDGGYARVA